MTETATKMRMKQYIGLSRDHSGSMRLLVRAAAQDYNESIAAIKEQASAQGIDTVVSVVKCGAGPGPGRVVPVVVNSSVSALSSISVADYDATGGSTPLLDSVGQLIEMLEAAPDAGDPCVSFLIMVTTDGEENASTKWKEKLAAKIRQLQATDRWTFVFRVPSGHGRTLERFGIPSGNVLEWDVSERGLATSSVATQSAVGEFYRARAAGAGSTRSFYTSLRNVKTSDVQAALSPITSPISIIPVGASDNDRKISEFVEAKTGRPLRKGTAFYQLTKTEKEVQDYKVIIIRDRTSGAMYSGPAARTMLGLPTTSKARVVPGDHGAYDVFIQSTSLNRKVPAGTSVLLWEAAAV